MKGRIRLRLRDLTARRSRRLRLFFDYISSMFRFSIREIFLLITVCGMGFGWWLDRTTLADRITHYKHMDDREHENKSLRRENEYLYTVIAKCVEERDRAKAK